MSEIKFTTNPIDKKNKSNKSVGKIVLIAVIVFIALIVVFNCFSIVNEGFVGVKYRFGKIVADDLTAGLNFQIPFVEEIKQVDIREQVYATTTDAYTSDTQTVQELSLKLNYSYDKNKLSDLIREVGISNVESKLLIQNVAKITKNEIGKVKIENLSFDDAFEQSIQNKVIAAQDALKMENKTKEKEEEAKQIVIAAQAEADSQKLAADAQAYAIQVVQEQLKSSPDYIDYLKITNWNGVLPQVMSDGINPFLVLDSEDEQTGTSASVQAAE